MKSNKAGYSALTSVRGTFLFISLRLSGKVRLLCSATLFRSGVLRMHSFCSHSLCRFKDNSSSPSGKGGSQLIPPLLNFSATGCTSEALSFSPFVENYFRVISYTFPFVSEFVIELGKPGILKFEYKHFCIITIFWSSGLGVLIVRVGVYSGLLNLLRKHSGTLPSGDRCTWGDMVTLMT